MAVVCPRCKTALRFEYSGSWALVCGTCDALVLRDGTLHAASKDRTALVEDLSPLRVGDAGKVNGNYFRITGRLRAEGQRGYRNFWSLKGDTPYTWLIQAFGNYALVSMSEEVVSDTMFRGVKPGKLLKRDGGFEVETLDNGVRYAWEGELMHALPIPWEIELEAGDPDGQRVLLLVDRTRAAKLFKGLQVEFVDLALEDPTPMARWI